MVRDQLLPKDECNRRVSSINSLLFYSFVLFIVLFRRLITHHLTTTNNGDFAMRFAGNDFGQIGSDRAGIGNGIARLLRSQFEDRFGSDGLAHGDCGDGSSCCRSSRFWWTVAVEFRRRSSSNQRGNDYFVLDREIFVRQGSTDRSPAVPSECHSCWEHDGITRIQSCLSNENPKASNESRSRMDGRMDYEWMDDAKKSSKKKLFHNNTTFTLLFSHLHQFTVNPRCRRSKRDFCVYIKDSFGNGHVFVRQRSKKKSKKQNAFGPWSLWSVPILWSVLTVRVVSFMLLLCHSLYMLQ